MIRSRLCVIVVGCVLGWCGPIKGDQNAPMPTVEEPLVPVKKATDTTPTPPKPAGKGPIAPTPTAVPPPHPSASDDLTAPDSGPVVWQPGGLHPHDRILITLLGVSQVHALVELDDHGGVDLLFLINRHQNFLNLTTLDITNKVKMLLQQEGWNDYTVNISKPVTTPDL